MVHFLAAYIHIIAMVVWALVSVAILLRYFKTPYIVQLPWWSIVVFVVFLHIAYVALVAVGQYELWAASEFTRDFLTQPLASDVPFPSILEWARPWFAGPLGYFSFYVLGRFVMSLAILFVLTLVCFGLLLIRAKYRPINFQEGDIAALTLAVLVSGWPGVIVLIPLGFIVAIAISIGSKILYGSERTYLPPAFLIAAPVAFLFGVQILKALNLYTLLKL